MKIGELIYDYALGMNGIVVGEAWTEINEQIRTESARRIDWEWLVLYECGELEGADTNDLKVVE